MTAGNVHDSQPYLERLDRQCEAFGLDIHAVGLDAGYFTPMVCQGLEVRGVVGVMGYRRPGGGKGLFSKGAPTGRIWGAYGRCARADAICAHSTPRLGLH